MRRTWLAFLLFGSFLTPALGQPGTTTRVSVSSIGEQGDKASGGLSVSADGRHVAFDSSATNLVAGDTNITTDVFVRRFWKTPQLISPHR